MKGWQSTCPVAPNINCLTQVLKVLNPGQRVSKSCSHPLGDSRVFGGEDDSVGELQKLRTACQVDKEVYAG